CEQGTQPGKAVTGQASGSYQVGQTLFQLAAQQPSATADLIHEAGTVLTQILFNAFGDCSYLWPELGATACKRLPQIQIAAHGHGDRRALDGAGAIARPLFARTAI